LLFSCHPSPQPEDLLLVFLLPGKRKGVPSREPATRATARSINELPFSSYLKL